MNATQFYISVAVMPVTTIIIVLIGVVLNNSRLADVNARLTDMNAQINTRFQNMETRFQSMEAHFQALMQANSDRQDANLRRVENELLGKFAEQDDRLNRIEHYLKIG